MHAENIPQKCKLHLGLGLLYCGVESSPTKTNHRARGGQFELIWSCQWWQIDMTAYPVLPEGTFTHVDTSTLLDIKLVFMHKYI